MTNLKISVGVWTYDRTQPLLDGRIKIANCDAEGRQSVRVRRFDKRLRTGHRS